MKDVKCPNCGNYGNAGTMDDIIKNNLYEESDGLAGEKRYLAFRHRGQIEGYPVWICNGCNEAGVIMKIGFWGKPKPLTGNDFQLMKEQWERGTGTKF